VNNAQAAWQAAAHTETAEQPLKFRSEAYFAWLEEQDDPFYAQAALLASADQAGALATPAEVLNAADASLPDLLDHEEGAGDPVDEVIWSVLVPPRGASASGAIPVGAAPFDALLDSVAFIPTEGVTTTAQNNRAWTVVDETGNPVPAVLADLTLDASTDDMTSMDAMTGNFFNVTGTDPLLEGTILSVHDDVTGSLASPGGLLIVKLVGVFVEETDENGDPIPELGEARRWLGRRWAGRRWAGRRWAADEWDLEAPDTIERVLYGRRWAGRRWAGRRWAGRRWAGRRWAGRRWAGRRWA
jgi:hypothetical protein